MSNIVFHPFVGKNYQAGINDKRILVLGESHYCASTSDVRPTLTTEIIEDLFDPKSPHEGYKTTYIKFIQALAGRDLSFQEREELWNRLAFYNYVQVPMVGPRVAPSSADFANSEDAFFQVLKQLDPDKIIVWGKRLFENMPATGFQGPDISIPGFSPANTWIYSNGSKDILTIPINHPSSGFDSAYWHSVMCFK
ncbi:hypothetical protein [Falsiporphyromonas endometrii]|uniref:Uracil-DNA glycosylase-like domain-containing protein n=1 Tax=Falsiporphyromonas endometrii TaxID=1387297 RepID=A0ABV9K980_9PORP